MRRTEKIRESEIRQMVSLFVKKVLNEIGNTGSVQRQLGNGQNKKFDKYKLDITPDLC